jgi:uncharacterized protein (TIGR03435 family)
MLRSLLAERFNLTLRRELRELPIYSLVIAGPGGKLGPNLHASEDCTATHRETAPTAGDQAALCGVRGSPGRLIFGGMPISVLVFQPALVREVRRVVVDRTGLTGFFDGTLEWTPSALATAPFGTADAPSPPVDGPSIFAAVQEQLGLRLAPTKGPVEVFVVESVARPTPD